MRWRRLRKWAKWTCTLAAGAAVTLAVFSRFYFCQHIAQWNSGGTVWAVYAGQGRVRVYHTDGVRAVFSPQASGWRMGLSGGWGWPPATEVTPLGSTWNGCAGLVYARGSGDWGMEASLLYPVALTLIPAALLWYADRRRRGPGLCGRCGYDRAGLALGVKCPECGTVPTPAVPTK